MADSSRIDPIAIDVSALIKRSVTSLYSHLVTRPTGRAVRVAIESLMTEQLGGGRGRAISSIDLSEVRILDFSCADEVVAKLLARYLRDDRPRDAFFVFRGVQEVHRDAIDVVLRRQSLAAVAETERGFELLGEISEAQGIVWSRVEEVGHVPSERVMELFPITGEREALAELAVRRLVLCLEDPTTYRSLSSLAGG